MINSYKNNNSLDKRKCDFNRIRAKHINYIPVIINCCKNLEKSLKKTKFLVPNDVSSSHLLFSIRKHIKIDSSTAIFMFVDNTMLCSTVMMSDIYNNYCEKNKNKDDFDGFLYVNITTENTFG